MWAANRGDVCVCLVASQSASITSIAPVSFRISSYFSPLSMSSRFPFFIFTNLTPFHSFCFLFCLSFDTFLLLPVIFKEVNTCNPATITGTLSRISLDDDEDPKLQAHQEGGVNFSALPGNIPPPNLIVQVSWMKKNTLQT